MCKRPLIKRCDSQDKYGAPSQNEPKIVCETFFETACNTTDVVPAPGDEPLPVTFCDKIPRKICAPDNCRVVEGNVVVKFLDHEMKYVVIELVKKMTEA